MENLFCLPHLIYSPSKYGVSMILIMRMCCFTARVSKSNITNINCEISIFAILSCRINGTQKKKHTFPQAHKHVCLQPSLDASQQGITQSLLSVKPVEHYRKIVLNNGPKPQLATVQNLTAISCQSLFREQEKLFQKTSSIHVCPVIDSWAGLLLVQIRIMVLLCQPLSCFVLPWKLISVREL